MVLNNYVKKEYEENTFNSSAKKSLPTKKVFLCNFFLNIKNYAAYFLKLGQYGKLINSGLKLGRSFLDTAFIQLKYSE